MKKKIFSTFILSIMAVLCIGLFSGCSSDIEEYNNLETSGTIYFDGEQTIKLSMSEHSQDTTTFKDTITTNDVTLSGVLDGKIVKSVEYVDETTVTLVLDGKVTLDKSHENDAGKITVSYNALANNAYGTCYVMVDFEPEITSSYSNTSTEGGKKHCVSEYTLPYGSFIEENVNSTNVVVAASTDADITISLTNEGNLRIDVKNFETIVTETATYSYPIAKISANVTTFNIDIYIYVGRLSYCKLV